MIIKLLLLQSYHHIYICKCKEYERNHVLVSDSKMSVTFVCRSAATDQQNVCKNPKRNEQAAKPARNCKRNTNPEKAISRAD